MESSKVYLLPSFAFWLVISLAIFATNAAVDVKDGQKCYKKMPGDINVIELGSDGQPLIGPPKNRKGLPCYPEKFTWKDSHHWSCDHSYRNPFNCHERVRCWQDHKAEGMPILMTVNYCPMDDGLPGSERWGYQIFDNKTESCKHRDLTKSCQNLREEQPTYVKNLDSYCIYYSHGNGVRVRNPFNCHQCIDCYYNNKQGKIVPRLHEPCGMTYDGKYQKVCSSSIGDCVNPDQAEPCANWKKS